MRNVDQFRHAINGRRTGDRAAYSDPAAATLGTDDEAAGTPATQERLGKAWAAEQQAAISTADKSSDARVHSAQDVRQVKSSSSDRGSELSLYPGYPGLRERCF